MSILATYRTRSGKIAVEVKRHSDRVYSWVGTLGAGSGSRESLLSMNPFKNRSLNSNRGLTLDAGGEDFFDVARLVKLGEAIAKADASVRALNRKPAFTYKVGDRVKLPDAPHIAGQVLARYVQPEFKTVHGREVFGGARMYVIFLDSPVNVSALGGFTSYLVRAETGIMPEKEIIKK